MSEEDNPVVNNSSSTTKGGPGQDSAATKKKHHQKGHVNSQAANPTAPPQEGPAGGSVDGKQQCTATGKAPARKSGSTNK